MRRKNKKMTMYLLVALVLCISVGFAILSTSLSINGTTSIKGASWDVHFANIQPTTGSVTPTTAPSISDLTTVSYEIELEKPGDFYEFTIDVVNGGSIDAMIDSFTISPTLTTQQQKYLEYSVEYSNGAQLSSNNLLTHGTTKTLKIRTAYKTDVDSEDLPSSNSTLTMSLAIDYVQADENASEPTRLVQIISGNGTTVGSEISIGDEHFYVIGTEESNTKLLAKYNLLVGNQWDRTNTTPLANPTGIQDSTAIGHTGSNATPTNPYIGAVEFSSINYWVNGYSLKSEYGSSYPAYVYDDNASIKTYVDNYKSYLEGLGVTINSTRLINYEELISLGCDASSYTCTSSAPSWVYATSYWSGSARSGDTIWFVFSNGVFDQIYPYKANYCFGVRPVIIVPTSSI